MTAWVMSAYQVALFEGKNLSRTAIPATIIKNGVINVRRNLRSFLVESRRHRNAKDIVAEAYSVNPSADPAATPDIPKPDLSNNQSAVAVKRTATSDMSIRRFCLFRDTIMAIGIRATITKKDAIMRICPG